MNQTEIILAGFGGQGVLFAGQLIAYAAMDSGMHVTWIPSYGPEMRGGTANCTVVVSDMEIGSPNVRNPRALIAFNPPSLVKYQDQVVPGGIVVVNASLVHEKPSRQDVTVLMVPANRIAEEIGNPRMTNMVLVGALLSRLPVLPLESLETALEKHLPERHHRFLPMNIQALHRGAEFTTQKAQ